MKNNGLRQYQYPVRFFTIGLFKFDCQVVIVNDNVERCKSDLLGKSVISQPDMNPNL